MALLPAPTVFPAGTVSTASVVWRAHGRWCVTVVVKATFAFVPGGPMAQVDPEPVVVEELHDGDSPLRGIRRASDLVLFRRFADVTFTGHAYAPAGQPVKERSVRLGLHRHRPLIDKTLLVIGDRRRGEPAPFQQMPIVYDRAFGGPGCDDNPLGVGFSPAARQLPNIVDPVVPGRAAGFGPISKSWPDRRRRLSADTRKALRAPIPELPSDFDETYFQSAPADQRVDPLVGDEWIVLEGLHPTHARLATALPGARAELQIIDAEPAPDSPFGPPMLRADTLVIDGDARRCSLTFRAVAVFNTEAEVRAVSFVAGVALPDRPIVWPEIDVIDPDDLEAAPVTVAGPAPSTKGRRSFSVTQEVAPDGPPPPVVLREDGAGETTNDAVAAPPAGGPEPYTKTLVIEQAPARPEARRPPVVRIEEASPRAAPRPPPPNFATTTEVRPDAGVAPSMPFVAGIGPGRNVTNAPIPGAPWRDAPASEAGAPPPPADRGRSRGRPPRRPGGPVPILFRDALSGATLGFQVRPPACSLTIVIKGTFDLVPGGPARLREPAAPPLGEEHAGEPLVSSVLHPDELAIFKPRADVLLRGHAYAPGAGATSVHVRFQLGAPGAGFDRRLAAIGDRSWEAGAPGKPRPFRKMPLVFERAFGGAFSAANPVGVGRTTDEQHRVALPNLEDPDHLLRSLSDEPPPVCFCGVAARWPARWSKIGTYDERYRAERWPYFPADFDWSFFQSAPPEQQLDHLAGNEPFALFGLHPAHGVLEGRLPGLRARCFAQLAARAGGGFHEVLLRLDTVAFDPDTMTLSLAWRGLLEIADEDAHEIEELYALVEPLAQDTAVEQIAEAYREAARQRERPPDAERPPAGLAPTTEAEAPANDTELPAPEGAGMDEVDAKLEAHVAELRQKMAALGAPLPALDEDAPPPPRAALDPAAAFERMRAAGMKEEDIESLREAVKDLPPTEEETSATETVVDDADGHRMTRFAVIDLLGKKAPLDGLDLGGLDLHGLDFSGCSMKKVLLVRTRLRKAKLVGANLAGAQASEADLREATLDGADLTQADLTKARLRDATAKGATVENADLSSADATSLQLQDARGPGATFAGASLSGARFDRAKLPGADFSGATLDDASFAEADLANARFYDVVGARVSFQKACLDKVRAEDASFSDAAFDGASAKGSVWDGAALHRAFLRDAVLPGASFVAASCREAVLSGSDLTEASFIGADLTEASLLKAKLNAAKLERADLTAADLRGACLHGAELWKAKLDRARLDLAIVTQTKLEARR